MPSEDVPHLLVALAYSADACRAVSRELEMLRQHLGDLIVVRHFACDIPGAPEALYLSPETCAAAIVLEREGLSDELYCRWVDECIAEAARRDDFSVFVCLHGMTRSELEQRADAGDPLLRNLRDGVQLDGALTRGELRDAVRQYLGRLRHIRGAAAWRSFRSGSLIGLGSAAALVEGLSAGAIIADVAASRMDSIAHAFGGRVPWTPETGAFAFGVAAAVLVIWCVCLVRARRRLVEAERRVLSFIVLGIAAGGWVAALYWLRPPWSWGLLGVAAGLVLESWRWLSGDARRSRLHVTTEAHDRIDSRVRQASAWRWPVLPPWTAQVFISYSRNSSWATGMVPRLYSELQGHGLRPFLDRHDIHDGSSWRRQLGRGLAQANIFVLMLDDSALASPWVAAELRVALAGRALTGFPRMIIVARPGLRARRPSTCFPFFEFVWRPAGAMPDGEVPTVLETDDVQIPLMQALSESLDPASVLPARTGRLLEYVLLPVTLLGGAGFLLAVAAAVFWLVDTWSDRSMTALLATTHMMSVSILVCAGVFGFLARMTEASYYQPAHDSPGLGGALHFLAALALCGVVAVWLRYVPAIVAGCTGIAFVLGWYRASVLLDRHE